MTSHELHAIAAAIELLDEAALLAVINKREGEPPPVWVLGSGVSVPTRKHAAGVPPTARINERIVEELKAEAPEDWKGLEPELRRCAGHASRYQLLCKSFIEALSEQKLMRVIQREVLSAMRPPLRKDEIDDAVLRDELLLGTVGTWVSPRRPISRSCDWQVRPGLTSLARFIANHPNPQHHVVLTTNFDPLISVAFNEALYPHVRLSVDMDYPLTHVDSGVPLVCHLHGHWVSGRLLHCRNDLDADSRAKLTNSLHHVLRKRQIVVIGYGGWDDVAVAAIERALADDSAELHWAFYAEDARADLLELLDQHPQLATASGVKFYQGVDADSLLPRLERSLHEADARRGKARERNAPAQRRKRLEYVRRRIWDMKAERDELRRTLEERQSHAERLRRIDEKLEQLSLATSGMPPVPRSGTRRRWRSVGLVGVAALAGMLIDSFSGVSSVAISWISRLVASW